MVAGSREPRKREASRACPTEQRFERLERFCHRNHGVRFFLDIHAHSRVDLIDCVLFTRRTVLLKSLHRPAATGYPLPARCSALLPVQESQRGRRVPRLHELDRARARQGGTRADGRSDPLSQPAAVVRAPRKAPQSGFSVCVCVTMMARHGASGAAVLWML